MIDKILNGLGVSSRRRRKTDRRSSIRNDTAQTYTVETPSGVYSNLTLEQYNNVKQALADYNTAYGIAYSYNVSAPSWTDFNGDNGKELIDAVVIKAINSGNTSKSESWAKEAETRAAELGIQTQAQPKGFKEILIGEEIVNVPISEYDARKKQFQEAAKLSIGYGIKLSPEMKKQIYLGYGDDILSSMQQKAEKAANDWLIAASKHGNKPNINIPEPTNVQTLPPTTDGDKKEKGSSLLIPGIILALGIFGAIMLTSKSKRR